MIRFFLRRHSVFHFINLIDAQRQSVHKIGGWGLTNKIILGYKERLEAKARERFGNPMPPIYTIPIEKACFRWYCLCQYRTCHFKILRWGFKGTS